MSLVIKHIEYVLPTHTISNLELAQLHPGWDIEKVGEKSGVFNRHIAQVGETALDLSKQAIQKLFDSGVVRKEDIQGIIFCTQSPDYIMPSNSFLIHKEFGFGANCWSFDFNLACSGFVYGLAIARGMLQTGTARNILLINADTYSKFIHPGDRSTSVLFGDGAAVTHLCWEEGKGMVDVELASWGEGYEAFYIPAGAARLPKTEETAITTTDTSGNIRTKETIHMNGFAVWKFISQTVPKQIQILMERNNTSFDDLGQVIFHQASKLTIDSLVKVLRVDPTKVFLNIDKVGNTVSASIPIALKDAMDQGKIQEGDLVLMSGFGVGLSWASTLIRF